MINQLKRYYAAVKRYWLVKHDPIAYARSIGVQIGKDCRLLNTTVSTFGSEPFLIRLGDHVTITSGVRFITHDGGVWVFRHEYPNIEAYGPIVVRDNVFIGTNAIILPGVRIGCNVIVGAGSIVTKDVPDNSVVAGVPARILKTIDQYWQDIQPQVLHLKDRNAEKKRAQVLEHFADYLR
ncbi:MAG: acyltransferase [Anaerolineae bacterium]|nr:acyltransferase [Anaerolineae bacterium]